MLNEQLNLDAELDERDSRMAESLKTLGHVVRECGLDDEQTAFDALLDIARAASAFVDWLSKGVIDSPEKLALEEALLRADMHPRERLVEDS
jgi:hypothetical protein